MTKMPPPIAYTKHFLSRIPGRAPTDKLHANVGHAKSAVNNYFNGYKGYGGVPRNSVEAKHVLEKVWAHTGNEMEIYELTDGAWVLLYTVRPGDEELPWKKGELADIRDRIRAEHASGHDKLSLEDLDHALAAYDTSDLPRRGYPETRNTYVKGFEDGFKAARLKYNKDGS